MEPRNWVSWTKSTSVHRAIPVVLLCAFGVLLLASLYAGLRSSFESRNVDNVWPPRQESFFKLAITEPGLVEQFPKFKVSYGDHVTLKIESDRVGLVYLHGYEKAIDVGPDAEVELTFIANAAGTFPLHFHNPDGSMRLLATLEVQPK
jgi:hypothetical protein